MKRKHLKKIITALEKLRQGKGEFESGDGICGFMEDALNSDAWDVWNRTRHDAWSRWKHFSGVSNYPVPGIAEHDNEPEQTYDWTDDLFDINTKYGRRRWELVEYLICWYKLELAKKDLKKAGYVKS